MDEHTQNIKESNVLESISFVVTGLVAFLMPFFFVPLQTFSFQAGKSTLFSIGVIVALCFYIIHLIKKGKITFPKNLFLLSVFLLPVVYLVSSIVNGVNTNSLLGFGFEMGTASFILLSAVFIFLVSELFSNKQRIFNSYLGFFISFGVVVLFQALRLFFGADFLSFGIFNGGASNLVGNWNDLGIFFGVASILSLVTIEMLEMKKLLKILLYLVFALSIVFLTIVNFSTTWIVLGIFALVVFLYIVSFDKFSLSTKFTSNGAISANEHGGHESRKKISYSSLALLIVSLVFIISGSSLGLKISDITKVTNLEVRPSWTSTFSVLKSELKASPLFGSGPNTFNNVWLMNKPAGINDSLFWNTDFAYGIGLIPTFFVTTGLLGLLAWLFFFAMFIMSGIRAIFYSINDLFSRYLLTSSFLSALFLWIMAIVYVPTTAIVVLTLFFTGLFVASLYREGLLKRKEITLSHHPRLSFVSILLLVVVLLSSITLGYLTIQKSVSLVYFQQSILGYQKDQNLDNAEGKMLSAINLGGYDMYYRGLSELNLIRVDSILSKKGATPESVRDEFQQVLGKSIENARMATVVNPQNYQNWASLARVYAALVPPPFSIPGAYENAKKTYDQALAVNPHSPSILLLMARLEVSNNNLKGAREFVNKSIAEKQNYAEAHFLLAQIEVSEGNVNKAIPSLETTVLLTPNNPGLNFQLGLLKYSIQDFKGAVGVFQDAVKMVPDYANAKYFLGLSLYRIGDTSGAISQFEDLKKTNPDNQEVVVILSNLVAGKDPFANAKPPITNRPEKRDKLPIEQTN